MIAKAHSATLIGIEAFPIVIEVDFRKFSDNETAFVMVGLVDKAVEESKVRVRHAIQNSGIDFPRAKVICNLAPGDVRKEGPFLDLPIAAAILAADEQLPKEELQRTLLLGELGLDGKLRSISGAMSVALMAAEKGFRRLILPAQNAVEAAVIPDLEVYGVRSLQEAVHLLNGHETRPPVRYSDDPTTRLPEYGVDYSDVKGQRHAIRALELAAAGGHNVLMVGPPGSGKTMLARRLPTILPPLGLEEAIEVTRIYSASGNKGDKQGLIWERPFRTPHHSASHASIVGGTRSPKPGEITLAHHGVLFMDELPES